MKKPLKISFIIIGSVFAIILLYYFFAWESNPNVKLYDSIKNTDKIVIMKVLGTWDNKKSVATQITTLSEVTDFISHLQVKKNRLGVIYAHGCYGDYDFVFYKNGNIITTINIGHGKELRWNGIWESDHKITNDCHKYLYGKFKEMGLELDPHEAETKKGK